MIEGRASIFWNVIFSDDQMSLKLLMGVGAKSVWTTVFPLDCCLASWRTYQM